jgi:hypothetical protein
MPSFRRVCHGAKAPIKSKIKEEREEAKQDKFYTQKRSSLAWKAYAGLRFDQLLTLEILH